MYPNIYICQELSSKNIPYTIRYKTEPSVTKALYVIQPSVFESARSADFSSLPIILEDWIKDHGGTFSGGLCIIMRFNHKEHSLFTYLWKCTSVLQMPSLFTFIILIQYSSGTKEIATQTRLIKIINP